MSLATLLDQLDADPRRRGREFEQICKWFLRTEPEYRSLLRQVWLWDEWPGRWGPDAGIDLVAEDHDGGLWAIQAKAYDESYWLRKQDIDSFLTESSRPGFTYRLVIATTDRVGPTARRTMQGQAIPVGLLLRGQLEQATITWPRQHKLIGVSAVEPKIPLPHVEDAIAAIADGIRDKSRAQCVMASGTGKTLVGMWSSERIADQSVLVLVPSLTLLAQTLREWALNSTKEFAYLAVCSDQTVAEDDGLVANTVELGLPVTTDPNRIARFMKREGRRIVFATYQSSSQIAAAASMNFFEFDLIIADEAHRTAGRVDSAFAVVLDDSAIPAKKRLFMTATPRYYTRAAFREAGQVGVDIASMDDHSAYGPVIHRLTFGEAIKRQILSDYQVVVVAVSDDESRKLADKGAFVSMDGEVRDARTIATQLAVLKAMRRFNLHRVVSFHGRVKLAKAFAEYMPALATATRVTNPLPGPLWAGHVSGTMTSGERGSVLRAFTGLPYETHGLLTNARCLVEGVNVPSIDGVVFVDPRRSVIDIIQAVGRAIRRSPDKKIGTILLPIFVPAESDMQDAVAASPFKPVWDVINALRAHDESLGEELDALRRELGRRGTVSSHPRKIILDVARELEEDFSSAFDVRLVENTTASWEFWYGLLCRFADSNGHARPQADYRQDGYPLGQWVANMRAFKNRGERSLTESRRLRLEALPGWSWKVLEDNWQMGLRKLLAYVAEHGDARVPLDAEYEGFPLGRWVRGRRASYTKGRLSAEKVAVLERLPGWAWNAPAESWEDAFAELKCYVRSHGVARPAVKFKQNGLALGAWVDIQRMAYKAKRISADRIVRLEQLPGWTWTPLDSKWEQGFAALQTFVLREGHARVPKDHDEDGVPLGTWVGNQREFRARGSLADDRQARLERLTGWVWDAVAALWDDAFGLLLKYVEREGHAKVPLKHLEDGFRLGAWVAARRGAFRKRKLPADRAQLLAALPGWVWNPRTEATRGLATTGALGPHQPSPEEPGPTPPTPNEPAPRNNQWQFRVWQARLEQLERFVAQHGHSRVPNTYTSGGFGLGVWVESQRRSYKRGSLPEDLAQRLEALPAWSWEAKADDWWRAYKELEKFVAREGHAKVPQDHREGQFGLGAWVSHQRGSRSRMAEDRRHALEALTGWQWNAGHRPWEVSMAALERYAEREGHIRVPPDHFEDGIPIGAWAERQRVRGRNKFSEERARRLESLPGWAWRLRRI